MRQVLGSRKNYPMTGTVQVFDEKRGQGDLVMERGSTEMHSTQRVRKEKFGIVRETSEGNLLGNQLVSAVGADYQ